MGQTIRESDVDVDEIRRKLTPQHVDYALSYVEALERVLAPLREGYPDGTSPEVLRALFVMKHALEDAF